LPAIPTPFADGPLQFGGPFSTDEHNLDQLSVLEDNLDAFSVVPVEDNDWNGLAENDIHRCMSSEDLDRLSNVTPQQSTPATSTMETNYLSSQPSDPNTSIQESSRINNDKSSTQQSTLRLIPTPTPMKPRSLSMYPSTPCTVQSTGRLPNPNWIVASKGINKENLELTRIMPDDT